MTARLVSIAMYIILEALDGPAAGTRANIAPGQTLRVGRNSDNDLVVPNDLAMSRWHFELTCDGTGCVLRDVNSRSGTFVNGRRMTGEEPIADGDELQAGKSRFSLKFELDRAGDVRTSPSFDAVDEEETDAGAPPQQAMPAAAVASPQAAAARPAPGALPPVQPRAPRDAAGSAPRNAPPAAASGGLPPVTPRPAQPVAGDRTTAAPSRPSPTPPAARPIAEALEVPLDPTGLRSEPLKATLGRVRLDEEAAALAPKAPNVRDLVKTLTDAGLAADALKVVAAALPPQAAVLWACRSVRDAGGLTDADAVAVGAAERWAAEPTEENRRAAQAAAESLEYGTAAAWAAMAAFWSCGSMAPPDVPAVPPPPDLMPQAIFGALSLAAIAPGAEKIPEMQKRFLTSGLAPKTAGST